MKQKRHLKILELISKQNIGTQEELAQELYNEGFDVTQATVSRDIKELRLVKTTSNSGETIYITQKETKKMISEKLITVLKQSYISCSFSNNILIIKTLPGMASAAASAIDSLDFEEILGTIAGDDTIISVTSSEETSKIIMQYFEKELRG